MNIQQINNVSFQKKRYISKSSLDTLKSLNKKINNDTVYTDKGTNFQSKSIISLNMFGNTLKTDCSQFLDVVPSKQLDYGVTEITFANNYKAVIDNTDGELVEYKKSFLTPIKTLIKNVEEILELYSKYYNDRPTIEKKYRLTEGFTQEGVNKILKRPNL